MSKNNGTTNASSFHYPLLAVVVCLYVALVVCVGSMHKLWADKPKPG